VLVLLITIIRKTFTDELNQEMKHLVISEVIFVTTFLVRVALIFCVLTHNWIDFSRDYPGNMNSSFQTVMFPLQFLLYNFVPYITLMYMHYKNFTEPTVEDKQNQRESFTPVHFVDSKTNSIALKLPCSEI